MSRKHIYLSKTTAEIVEAKDAEIASLRAERNTAYAEGWDTAHEPAKCGHARANWKDQKFGTSEYDGDERCEICAEIDTFRAAARQDAEKIARLRAALQPFADHNNWDERTMSWIAQRDLPWEIAYAALACRPQGEKS